MPYGLTEKQLETIWNIFKEYPQIEKVVIFGSRATGDFKTGSDIDLALKGDVTLEVTDKIMRRFNEETLLPHKFDIINYHTISNKKLKKHIERFGKIFWHRK